MVATAHHSPLTLGQKLTVAWTRAVFGTAMEAIALYRGDEDMGLDEYTYGPHSDERYEILPATEHPDGHQRKPVVYFHGGGWMMGYKEFYRSDLTHISEAGHQVFNVEYPKAPDHPHPHILRSLLAALTYIKQEHGVTEVHLVGDSAGGNLAVMAALVTANPDLRIPMGVNIETLDLPKALSCTSLYGVLDRQSCLNGNVPGGHAMIAAYGGQAALQNCVGPAHAITPMDLMFKRHPPCFLAVGSQDVLLPSSETYHDRLQKEGHDVRITVYGGANHGFMSVPRNELRSALLNDMTAFLAEIESR